MDYKKYSLENLENCLHDALSCEEASPHEIYSVIRKVVEDEYDYHKEKSQQCFGLLELMSGHRPVKPVDNGMRPWGHSDLEYILANPSLSKDRNSNFPNENTVCDRNDPSPECKGAWNDFWEEVDEDVKEGLQEKGYDWTPPQK